MTIEITVNNLIALDNRYVGRICKTHRMRNQTTRVFTGKTGDFSETHVIGAPVYLRGETRDVVNPAFEAALRAIVK